MAKPATIITILFAALVLFAALEAPTMVQGRSCDKPSGTWSSQHCWNNNACNNQCVRVEGAQRGACNYRVPGGKCVCYFPWPCEGV